MGAALSTAIVASGAIRALDATREDEVGVPAAVWYARPVLLVSDVQVALRFYLDTLGFTKTWHVTNVCQVNRGGCGIILCKDPARHDPDGNEILFPPDENNDRDRHTMTTT